MNIILFSRTDRINDRVVFRGRQAEHIKSVLKAKPGDEISVGEIDGMMGTAKIMDMHSDISCTVNLYKTPPLPLPLTLLLALPRPKALKRILQSVASLGIKSIYLFGCWKVEKSYWSSPVLADSKLRENLILGLEQSRDTLLPKVERMPLFKPFMEDKIPDILGDSLPLVAHPGASQQCPFAVKHPVTLAIGPEGGFIDYEIKKFLDFGFHPISLGPRILNSQVVIPYLTGRLFQQPQSE